MNELAKMLDRSEAERQHALAAQADMQVQLQERQIELRNAIKKCENSYNDKMLEQREEL